jgi:hypothetical protein
MIAEPTFIASLNRLCGSSRAPIMGRRPESHVGVAASAN